MPKKKLTPMQASYVKIRGSGKPKVQSAILAGYSDTGTTARDIETSVVVREALVKEARTYEKAGKITKLMVMEGLLDAVEMAKLLADPTGMVGAWREIAKICGYYAPETKKVEHVMGGLKGQLHLLTDEDLRQLKHGNVIDVDFKRLPEPPKDV